MSKVASKIAILSGRRSTYHLALALRDKLGTEAKAWTPEFERLAPLLVANPHLEVGDLIAGKLTSIRKVLAA